MRIILRVHDVQSMYGKPEESMTDNFMNFNTDTQIKKTEETKIKKRLYQSDKTKANVWRKF